jgi:hypothetical protein
MPCAPGHTLYALAVDEVDIYALAVARQFQIRAVRTMVLIKDALLTATKPALASPAAGACSSPMQSGR